MRTIIAGSRDFNDYALLNTTAQKFNITEVVSGGARGADTLGEQYAKEHDIPLKVFKAQWDLIGKSAGYRRNEEMAFYADRLIAFWNGWSSGTAHMINIARQKGLEVEVVRYDKK